MNKKPITEFKHTDDSTIAYKYDGFISPEGEFYLVSKKNKHNPTHFEWSDQYVVRELDYIKKIANPTGSLLFILSRLKNKQDILINFYGYIYYGHSEFSEKPILIYPNYDINCKFITSAQKQILYEVLLLNNEMDYLEKDIEELAEDELHYNYVDEFISKQLGAKYEK